MKNLGICPFVLSAQLQKERPWFQVFCCCHIHGICYVVSGSYYILIFNYKIFIRIAVIQLMLMFFEISEFFFYHIFLTILVQNYYKSSIKTITRKDFLFETYNADDECDGIDVLVREFKRIVIFVVGNDEDVLVVRSRLYALDNCTLRRVKDVGFVPLEE